MVGTFNTSYLIADGQFLNAISCAIVSMICSLIISGADCILEWLFGKKEIKEI
jgi:hypothetical protein